MRLFRLVRRRLWGDYGDLLQQGLLEGENGGLPWKYSGCHPFSPIMLPKKQFVCTDAVHRSILKAFPKLSFQRCIFGTIVSLDWRPWVETQRPLYPTSGEPIDYLSEWPVIDVAETLWILRPSQNCLLEPIDVAQSFRDFSKVLPPKLISHSFIEQEVVMGARFPTSRNSSELFCSEQFASFLKDVTEQNVLLEEYSLDTGEPLVNVE